MALDSENMVMPVSPLYGGNGSGFGGFGGDGWWIILLFILLGNGWGFGGFGGGAFGMGMMDGGFGLYPWLNNSQHISDGFRDQQLSTQISGLQNSVTSGFGDVQNSLCAGFAGVNSTINNAHSALSNQLYTNQIADLERSFAAQTANSQGLNSLQSALSNCCCENRAATADLKYTVATENCADRAALSDGIRDLLAATQAQTQTILTQMCNDKIEQKNDTIAQLRSELMYARGQASQDVQTAQILAGQASEIDGVYNRLKNCPVGTYSVCNPYIYPNSQTCGCGCGVA